MSTGFGTFKNRVIAISESEARIDQGTYYTASGLNENVQANEVFEILIVGPPSDPNMPARKQLSMHVFPQVKSGGDFTFTIFRNTIVSANGTPLIIGNHNGTEPIRPPESQVFSGPTIISDGDQIIDVGYIPGGTGKNATGGEASQSKWIIPADSIHLIRLVNISGQTTVASMELDFYEPVGGFGGIL